MRPSAAALALLALAAAAASAGAARCGRGLCAHGTCHNDTCLCHDGWQGPDCQFCGGKIRLVEPVGYIHDGPGNYSVGVKCSWLIEAARSSAGNPANATIRLHLEEFATECGWDHLYVYDGDSVDSPLLAVFSGLMYKDSYAVRSVPELITRSGSALLHFFSDDAYNMSGFNISYAVNACPSRYSSVNCSGHGTCENSECTCDDGWLGKACDRPTCPGNCSFSLKQGICRLPTQRCQCNPNFGGHDCSQPTKYGIWDPIEPSGFKPGGSASHGAAVWRDSLYIVGGEGYGRSRLMYTYDFNGGVWETPHSSSTAIPNLRYGASAVIHGDKIFLYGGVVTDHYNMVTANLQRHHGRHASSHLRNASGHLSHALPLSSSHEGNSIPDINREGSHETYNSAVTRVTGELWAFDISANTWENITVRTEPCNRSIAMCGPLQSAGHTATLVTLTDSTHRKPTEKMIVIFGHCPQFGYLNTVQEYNFGTREWVIVQTRGYPVKGGYGHTSAYDQLTEKIYVYGGMISESESNHLLNSNLYSYDPTSRIWTLLAHAPSARFLHTANFIMPGMMVVFGGNTHNDTSHSFGAKCYSNELLAYDVVCDSWHYINIPHDHRENLARFGHSGTVFEGSLYLFGGFDGQMLNDMIQFTPGHCHRLMTQTECLNSRIGVKCIWDVNKTKCINITEVPKDSLTSMDPDFDLSFIKCPEESRDKITQRLLSHKDRCSLQTDCTSCVQTSYACVWCPMGVCMNQRCSNSNYHTANQRKTITTLEECPVESGPVCAQLHSCIACIGASSTSRVGGHTTTAHSTPAQPNRVQETELQSPGSRSGLVVTSTNLKPLFGSVSSLNLHQVQCHWDYETGKCRAGNSSNTVSADTPEERNICVASCSDFTTCTNCTIEECIWCQNEARCVDKNAYTASFPYGQCREWTTEINRCRTPPNPAAGDGTVTGIGTNMASACAAYASCSSCREEPACGWCDDGSRTGLGVCLPGGAARPSSPYTCPNHTWHFTHCPSCQCNGHSTCSENNSVCNQPCGNLTMGQHCEKCSPGYWGNPLNGGKCQTCECNDQATLCSPDNGKCFCTTKGLAGDRCDKCDATNRYHGDPTNKGFCYYDLAVDYQFTFNLSKKEDRHFTQINFRNSPIKPDIDADFSITCSVLAKMNITIRTANGQEKTVFHSINCTTFRYRFAKADHNFGTEDNVTLTTFFVYVYDFQPPLWIQISFSQYPKLNLQQFFITFSSCFLLLLLVAAILWKIKQKYDMYRRRQRLFVEMEQMASRPFSQVLVEIEQREKILPESHQNHVVANPLQNEIINNVTTPHSVVVPTVRKRKKDSPSPIALEPCSGNKAAVLSLLVRLPTGGGSYTPPGQPAGLAVASALVTLGSPPRHSHAPDARHTDTKLSKRGKGIGAQHPDTCI